MLKKQKLVPSSVSGLPLACCFVPEIKATATVFSNGMDMFRLSLEYYLFQSSSHNNFNS